MESSAKNETHGFDGLEWRHKRLEMFALCGAYAVWTFQDGRRVDCVAPDDVVTGMLRVRSTPYPARRHVLSRLAAGPYAMKIVHVVRRRRGAVVHQGE